MPHVLLIALGPIQDFIFSARKCRDLWFGSWLLSELSKATALGVAEECGLEALVFPGVSHLNELAGGPSSTSVANKIVARLPEGKDPADVAEKAQAVMKARLEELRDEAFSKIERLPYFLKDPAQAQIGDLIEFIWASAPEHGEDGYKVARQRAEQLLAARKNTRMWSKVSWGAPVPKSAIDGERESVLHEDLFDGVKEKKLTPEEVRVRYGVGPAERLCGVGLLKRHGRRAQMPDRRFQYTHRFLSTGHLAAWPLFKRTENTFDPLLLDAWQGYQQTLRRFGVPLEEQLIVQGPGWKSPIFGAFDGSLLFESRLPDLFEEVTDPERRKAGIRAAREALSCVLKAVGVTTPLPYYAILQADGDHMGKAIERQENARKHRALSKQLDVFAQGVRSTVEQMGGELIYSGGDDVLAFVPLHDVVACARTLAESFAEALKDFRTDQTDENPTLSVGIAISHFLDPLSGALRLARRAEALAKVRRSSLAVIVDKRSGPPVEVTGPWGDLDQDLDGFVKMHRLDLVPDGAAYELRDLTRLLDGATGTERENLAELVRKEAARILRRKQPQHGAEAAIKKEILDEILAALGRCEIREVANRLIVARLLAQAQDEAQLPIAGDNS